MPDKQCWAAHLSWHPQVIGKDASWNYSYEGCWEIHWKKLPWCSLKMVVKEQEKVRAEKEGTDNDFHWQILCYCLDSTSYMVHILLTRSSVILYLLNYPFLQSPIQEHTGNLFSRSCLENAHTIIWLSPLHFLLNLARFALRSKSSVFWYLWIIILKISFATFVAH